MTIHARTILVIDGAHPGVVPEGAQQVSLLFSDVTAVVISTVLPDLVILPLFGTRFDAIDALTQLEQLGYRGDVLVRAPILPNARVVERELKAAAPALKVRLTGPMS